MKLLDLWIEILSDRWHKRDLERAGGDHDLIGLVGPIVELDPVGGACLTDRSYAAVQFDRKVEALGVVGQIDGDLVAVRVAVRVAGEVKAGKGVIARRREQLE